MPGFVPGTKTTYSDSADHILDLRDGLDFLNPRMDGIALLKKIGTNGFMAKSTKHEWTETALAGRSEVVTIGLAGDTTITVANAYQYSDNELLRVASEVMRVTGRPSATTLTVVRGFAGTTAAAHTAQTLYSLGSADPENALAPAGIADTGDRLFNYVQTLTRAVQLSNDEIAQASTDGNPMTGQLERRFIEANRQLARALFYGVRSEDTALKIRTMGGLAHFVVSNVNAVNGALTLPAIDAQILNIVEAGGDPKIIAVSPRQKQKLDALDANIIRQHTKTTTGGNPMSQTWQSGVLDHELDIIVDHSILVNDLWILDTDHVKVGPYSNNGKSGAFKVVDSTTPGQDGESKVLRGKYTMEVSQQKTHARLTGLTI